MQFLDNNNFRLAFIITLKIAQFENVVIGFTANEWMKLHAHLIILILKGYLSLDVEKIELKFLKVSNYWFMYVPFNKFIKFKWVTKLFLALNNFVWNNQTFRPSKFFHFAWKTKIFQLSDSSNLKQNREDVFSKIYVPVTRGQSTNACDYVDFKTSFQENICWIYRYIKIDVLLFLDAFN